MATVDGTFRVSSSVPVSSGGPGTAPAWTSGQAVGTWREVSTGTTLASVDPANDPELNPNHPGAAPWKQGSGQAGVLSLWNGGALAPDRGTHGALLLYGGGHNGYAGSEVYAVGLADGVIERVTDPYPGPFNFPYPSGAYPDGSAVPGHTYHYPGYHPPTKSFCILRGMTETSSTSSNSLDVGNAHFVNLETGVWRRAPINTALAGDFNSGGKACYDSINDCFWVIPAKTSGQKYICKLANLGIANPDGTYGVWTNYPQAGSGDIDGAMVFIPSKSLIVWQSFRASPYPLYGVKITNGVPEARVTLTQGGTIPTREGAAGFEYCEALDALIYWRDGANVYKIAVPATWATDSWDWSLLTSGGNVLAPAAPANGPYSKFKVVKYSDMSLAVTLTSVTSKLLAFRLS